MANQYVIQVTNVCFLVDAYGSKDSLGYAMITPGFTMILVQYY